MSPPGTHGFLTGARFPRVSGDEPVVLIRGAGTLRFSPRERG